MQFQNRDGLYARSVSVIIYIPFLEVGSTCLGYSIKAQQLVEPPGKAHCPPSSFLTNLGRATVHFCRTFVSTVVLFVSSIAFHGHYHEYCWSCTKKYCNVYELCVLASSLSCQKDILCWLTSAHRTPMWMSSFADLQRPCLSSSSATANGLCHLDSTIYCIVFTCSIVFALRYYGRLPFQPSLLEVVHLEGRFSQSHQPRILPVPGMPGTNFTWPSIVT